MLIAFGLGVGILIGLTGIGSLMMPPLVLFAGVPRQLQRGRRGRVAVTTEVEAVPV